MSLKDGEIDTTVRSTESGERFDVALIERLLPQLTWIATNAISRQWQAKVAVSDIIQDTFVEATQKLSQFSGTTIAEFNAWLRIVLTNNLRDAHRKYVDAQMRSVDRETSLRSCGVEAFTATDPSPSRAAETNEFDRELHRAIQRLGEIDRRIVNLRYQQKLTFPQIGSRLAMNADTVRERWARILIVLQRRLQHHDSRISRSTREMPAPVC